MTAVQTRPINTLDSALALAKGLSRSLAKGEGKAYRNYRIFAALTEDEVEALIAFLIWWARGATIRELY